MCAGLLAGLWEFPSAEIESDWSEERVWQQMLSDFQLRSDVPHNKLGTVRCGSHVNHVAFVGYNSETTV